MEFVDGVSLQEKLDREGPPGLKEIVRIGLQTAEGLAAAHRQGLVHRDIKPALGGGCAAAVSHLRRIRRGAPGCTGTSDSQSVLVARLAVAVRL